jgi:hypothetical protein
MVGLSRILDRPFFIRLLHWEYWSFAMVYTWIYPAWLLLALKARSLFFFAAANPSIKNGGFLAESKKDIYAIMSSGLYPPTIHFNAGESWTNVVEELARQGLNYPLIGKPDIGGRGRGVKLLKCHDDLRHYCSNCEVDFHIQKFVDFPNEAGIFYYRYPGEKHGRISGIVRKEFLKMTGDGKSSVRNLVRKTKRALLQMRELEEMYGSALDDVLPENETRLLVPYGNHARGAMFLDDSHLIDEKLTRVIDDACRQIKDFYFGRLDIRYNDWDQLCNGQNFCIIEVNGAGSEPTHIYDPKHSLLFAWREIVRHWSILCRISMMNHRRGHPYLTWKEARKMWKEDKENSRRIERLPL